MATDPFARDLAAIDRDLHEQVERRDKGITEVIHGCFTVERSNTVIDRLIEERLRASRVQV